MGVGVRAWLAGARPARGVAACAASEALTKRRVLGMMGDCDDGAFCVVTSDAPSGLIVKNSFPQIHHQRRLIDFAVITGACK